jgi:hypothetical protein
MMFIKAHTIKADLVHQRPRFQVLLIGTGGNLRTKVTFRQGPGQFLTFLEMIQMFGIGEQIKRKDLHGQTLQVCVPASWQSGHSITITDARRLSLEPTHV